MPVSLVRGLFLLAGLITLTPWINAPTALAGGALFAHFLGNPFASRGPAFGSWLLKASVIGLGFGLNLENALRVGKDGFWLTVASISLILATGFLAGHVLGLPRRLSHLLASGTAICGGSAIAAVGPAVRATGSEMSMALAVVFLLNALALLIFPPLGHALGMDEYSFGLWAAIAIHDTSSVVGAASAYGPEALHVAVTVKLARTLWIVPIALLSALLFRDRRDDTKTVPRLPLFVAGFVLTMLLNTLLPLPAWFTGGITALSRNALSLCLFLIGSTLTLQRIRETGWRPLALGLLLWSVCSVFSLAAIFFL